MKYDVFREKGYYIGSGAIESANKYLVKDRLKLSGMSWVIDGAGAIIHLRQKMYEKDWDMVKNYIVSSFVVDTISTTLYLA